MRIDQDNYPTTDRGLAAALMALGFELSHLDRGDRAIRFVFRVSGWLLEAVDAYHADQLAVSARRMADAMMHLEELTKGRASKDEVIDLDAL